MLFLRYTAAAGAVAAVTISISIAAAYYGLDSLGSDLFAAFAVLSGVGYFAFMFLIAGLVAAQLVLRRKIHLPLEGIAFRAGRAARYLRNF